MSGEGTARDGERAEADARIESRARMEAALREAAREHKDRRFLLRKEEMEAARRRARNDELEEYRRRRVAAEAEAEERCRAGRRDELIAAAITLECLDEGMPLNRRLVNIAVHSVDRSGIGVDLGPRPPGVEVDRVSGVGPAVAAFKAAWPALFEGLPDVSG